MNVSSPERTVRVWRYIAPNFFTALSVLLGITSIVLAFEGRLELSSWMILWCVMLDKADGTVARMLNATSGFGSELDSMADLIAFGLAPAMLTYAWGRTAWSIRLSDGTYLLLVAGVGVYALCAAARLARFNLAGFVSGSRHFQGLASTLCGVIVPAAILVATRHEVPVDVMQFFPVVLLLLGFGMVSNLPLPKVLPRKNKAFNIIQVLNVVFLYVIGFAMVLPEYVLGVALFYLVVGTTHGLVKGAG